MASFRMSVFLPRSSSEHAIKVNSLRDRCGEDSKILSVSSPELRSMLTNLRTTVPQNLYPEKLSSTHKPTRRRTRYKIHSVVEMAKRCNMSPCCSVRMFLIVVQIIVGCALTGVSTYAHLFVPAVRLREKPIWAGVPLLLAGLSGIFFIERDKKKEEGSTALFILKTACSALATISIFLCVTAAVFCVIHVVQLFKFAFCRHLANACVCYETNDTSSKSHMYSPVDDCFLVYCHIKIFVITLASLATVGGVTALFFVITIWKSRYGEINTESE